MLFPQSLAGFTVLRVFLGTWPTEQHRYSSVSKRILLSLGHATMRFRSPNESVSRVIRRRIAKYNTAKRTRKLHFKFNNTVFGIILRQVFYRGFRNY